MVLRHAKTAFGSTHVFPGGVLEVEDEQVADRCVGVDAPRSDAILGVDNGGLAYFSAAIRELFEEAGVLLARTRSGAWADSDSLAPERQALNAGRRSWSEFLKQHDLQLAADALHYFSYWITPRGLPKRFATRFFAAALPEGQRASHCGIETTNSCWVAPRLALEQNAEGGFELPWPTIMTLRALRDFDSAAAVLRWAAEHGRRGVERVLPVIVHRDGQRQFLMPGDPEYPPGRGES